MKLFFLIVLASFGIAHASESTLTCTLENSTADSQYVMNLTLSAADGKITVHVEDTSFSGDFTVLKVTDETPARAILTGMMVLRSGEMMPGMLLMDESLFTGSVSGNLYRPTNDGFVTYNCK